MRNIVVTMGCYLANIRHRPRANGDDKVGIIRGNCGHIENALVSMKRCMAVIEHHTAYIMLFLQLLVNEFAEPLTPTHDR